MHQVRVLVSLLFAWLLMLGLWLGLSWTPTWAEPTMSAKQPNTVLETVALTPTKDNTIYEGTTNLLSNGQGDHFFAGKNGNGLAVRGLLAFDVASSLPPSATIVSVTLQLNASTPKSGAKTVTLHRVLADWGEGTSDASRGEGGGAAATTDDATWVHTFFDTVQWTTPGGDFVATPSAAITVDDNRLYTWSSPEMVADVEEWIAEPSSNFGWLLQGDEDTTGGAKRFDSRDNATAVNRPRLTITFTTDEPPTENHLIYLPFIQQGPPPPEYP